MDILLNSVKTIQSRLAQLQEAFVINIRNAAGAAWEARFRSLSNNLGTIEVAVPYLRDEVVLELDHYATDLIRAVQEDTTAKIINSKDASTDPMAAWEGASERLLAHQKALANLKNSPAGSQKPLADSKEIDFTPNLSGATNIVVEAVNSIGYLIRPPVAGETNTISSITDLNWPILTDKFPKNATRDEFISNYRGLITSPWFKTIKKDTEDSLWGAITQSSKIAKDKVNGIIERRIDHLVSANGGSSSKSLSKIEELVVANAKCSALHGALDEICSRWTVVLAAILERNDTSSSEAGDAEEVTFDEEAM